MTEKEFTQVFLPYRKYLLNWARKLTCNNTLIPEDLVQETYLLVWEKKDKYKSKNPKAFISTILYHVFIDEYRKVKTRTFEVPDSIHSDAFRELEISQEVLDALRDYKKISPKGYNTFMDYHDKLYTSNDNKFKAQIRRTRLALIPLLEEYAKEEYGIKRKIK